MHNDVIAIVGERGTFLSSLLLASSPLGALISLNADTEHCDCQHFRPALVSEIPSAPNHCPVELQAHTK